MSNPKYSEAAISRAVEAYGSRLGIQAMNLLARRLKQELPNMDPARHDLDAAIQAMKAEVPAAIHALVETLKPETEISDETFNMVFDQSASLLANAGFEALMQASKASVH